MLDDLMEALTRVDCVDISKDLFRAEVAVKRVPEAAGIGSAVISPIADENSIQNRPGPLRSFRLAAWTRRRNKAR